MKIHPYEVAYRCSHDLLVSRAELEAALADSRVALVEPVIQSTANLDGATLSAILREKCRKPLSERTITVVGDRPSQAPISWEIWNAPRPIYGQELWESDFITGIFYAAINPFDEFSNDLRYENVCLHAAELVYMTPETHIANVNTYRNLMIAKYPRLADADFDMVERSYINRSPTRIVKVQS